MRAIEALPLDEQLSIGIDIGIGSCGLAALAADRIERLAVHGFSVPENEKKETLAAVTGDFRRQRRTTRHRRQRMAKLLRWLAEHFGLSPDQLRARSEILDPATGKPLDPWCLRTQGLKRLLSPLELAILLLHVAKHRGFRSNSKRDRAANSSKADKEGQEKKKALAGAEALRQRAAEWVTLGQMLACDPEFAERKRNRTGDYARTVFRDDLEREVAVVFERQRAFGNPLATAEAEREIAELAFSQRPLKASERLVGQCLFEPAEPRGSAFAPGVERFRYLHKLTTIRIVVGRSVGRPLAADEMARAAALFGHQSSITYKTLRRALALEEEARFVGVPRDKPAKGYLWEGVDLCRGKGAALGTRALESALRPILGELQWHKELAESERLDRAAFVLTFREQVRADGGEGDESIERGLKDSGLPEDWIEPLLRAAEEGAFAEFRGTTQLSAKAARAISAGLLRGLDYAEAARACGYDHSRQPELRLETLRNPVVKRILARSRRLLEATVRDLGRRPGRITIEMARDVGKPAEVREKIEKAQNARRRAKDDLDKDYRELVGRGPTEEERIAFQLWKEQEHCCPYSGRKISCEDLDLTRRALEIDHVLPESRSHENGYLNKVLCFTAMNQAKGNRTPYEWMVAGGGHPDAFDWEEFVAWVEHLKLPNGKKRKLLMRDFAEREGDFAARNLNDTRHAAKLFRAYLERWYEDELPDPETGTRRRRIYTRPGTLVGLVRRAWGLNELKKDREGRRIGDRHHALDAAIVASLGNDEGLTQHLTGVYQQLERRRARRELEAPKLPWASFKEDLREGLATLTVVRLEERKRTGASHEATIYGGRRVPAAPPKKGKKKSEAPSGGFEEVLVTRMAIHDVTEKHLAAFEELDRRRGEGQQRHAALASAVRAWMAEDPKARAPFPRMPRRPGAEGPGPEIRHLRIPTNKIRPDRPYRGGFLTNGDMLRVDVFRKDGRFRLVPIYLYQYVDRERFPTPPNRACIGGKPQSEWEIMGEEAEFLFSLHKGSLVRLESDGEVVEGYYRFMDISVAAIVLSPLNDWSTTSKRGVALLTDIQKWSLDILGRRTRVEREERQWPGAAST